MKKVFLMSMKNQKNKKSIIPVLRPLLSLSLYKKGHFRNQINNRNENNQKHQQLNSKKKKKRKKKSEKFEN